MIAPDVLSLATGSSEREIFRLIEAGYVHFIEDDRVLACANCYRESVAGNRNYKKEAAAKNRTLDK